MRVFADETFEEGEGEAVFGDAGDDLEIEVLGFGAVAVVEDFFAGIRGGERGWRSGSGDGRGGGGVFFRATGRGKEQGGGDGGGQEEVAAHGKIGSDSETRASTGRAGRGGRLRRWEFGRKTAK